ncbi:hypothetical protein [Succinimonas amylolytica]|uniref:hypothetical protein n=1 Tax=Succinimonas amylolytica TaxID=83769 RepID=UPI000A04F946|nr:hypothetical protein [Succinimonas amylolytica]
MSRNNGRKIRHDKGNACPAPHAVIRRFTLASRGVSADNEACCSIAATSPKKCPENHRRLI